MSVRLRVRSSAESGGGGGGLRNIIYIHSMREAPPLAGQRRSETCVRVAGPHTAQSRDAEVVEAWLPGTLDGGILTTRSTTSH